MKQRAFSLLLFPMLLLTACGSSQISPNSQLLTASQLSSEPSETASTALAAISLNPVANSTSQAQLKAEKQAPLLEEEVFSETEMKEIQRLLKLAEPKIAEEDREHAAQLQKQSADFAVKSAQQGKDVDIELFLYHPKYGKKAKSWGIDNAHEFLMAGCSPFRRWTLRLKLEGLFAPKNFSQQVLFWVEQADLLRISGVSREQAWLLASMGITSAPDLARRNNIIELTALQVNMKLLAFSNGMKAPSLSELEDWADEAAGLEPVIY